MAIIVSEEQKQLVIERLKNVQKYLGVTNSKMGEYFSVSESQYKKLCNGKSDLNIDKLFVLSAEFGINMNYLFDKDSDEEMFLKDIKRKTITSSVEELQNYFLELPIDVRIEKMDEIVEMYLNVQKSVFDFYR